MDEFAQSIFLEPNLVYIILIAASWIGAVALFVPGTGIIELFAVVGLLYGIGGLAYHGGSVIGLALFGVSCGLFALAILRQFSAPRISAAATQWPLSAWALMLSAAIVQFFGGVVLAASLPDLSLVAVLLLALGSLVIFRWMLMPAAGALRPPPRSGAESLIGSRAEVRHAPPTPGQPGTVYFNGELWQAVSADPLAPGDAVEVIGREGMRLHVRRVTPPGEQG